MGMKKVRVIEDLTWLLHRFGLTTHEEWLEICDRAYNNR
jgi:hypothetical protein